MDTVPTDGRFHKTKWAIRTENLFMKIVHQAVTQGMMVNASKTKAFLSSELKSYVPHVSFSDNEGGQVQAGDEMKILGVHFSTEPGIAAQVADIRKKFEAKIWALWIMLNSLQLLSHSNSVQAVRKITGNGFKGNLWLWTLIPCSPFPFKSLPTKGLSRWARIQVCWVVPGQP